MEKAPLKARNPRSPVPGRNFRVKATNQVGILVSHNAYYARTVAEQRVTLKFPDGKSAEFTYQEVENADEPTSPS
jgi:hypothetical protein